MHLVVMPLILKVRVLKTFGPLFTELLFNHIMGDNENQNRMGEMRQVRYFIIEEVVQIGKR